VSSSQFSKFEIRNSGPRRSRPMICYARFQIVARYWLVVKRNAGARRVRARSGPGFPREHLAWGGGCDGISHSSCALIRSLPLAVLTPRCAITSELTRRRAFIQIGNRQLEIGNEFRLAPLASNDLLGRTITSISIREGI
jgi:hypothetical protein